jgi:sulfoxide reductase heme-binding subunit YedZ
MTRRSDRFLRVAVHVAGMLPFLLLIWDGHHHLLGANPLQAVTFRTGKFALIFLVLSLAVTPLNTVFGWRQLVPLRRTLGLYCFFYAVLHVATFVWLDYNFDFGLLLGEIGQKRYVFIGLAAVLILLPLAITSTKGWQKRLGKRWKRLHQWVYVAGVLVIFHFLWLVKADRREPLAFGAVVALLLVARRPAVRRYFGARRAGARPPARPAPVVAPTAPPAAPRPLGTPDA